MDFESSIDYYNDDDLTITVQIIIKALNER